MENSIDIGIDFGAENIVVIAVGHDTKGRTDYKLINLDSSGSIKNYLGQKNNGEIDIGTEAKIAYLYNNQNNEYKWVSGRYKSYIKENSQNQFSVQPDELLKLGLTQIIKKLEAFDFSLLLSGHIRNLSVGIPQAWNMDKREFYKEILSIWKYGQVSLLSEPVAATIAAYKRSSVDLSENIIMIIDIGASTLDISFSKYSGESKSLHVYKTSYRSEFAGHYFDLILAAFTLTNESNKLAVNEVIDRVSKIKLRKVDDYINYLAVNQSKYSTLLLELENIKESYLPEIIKFNRKRLIDLGNKYPITINKQIYQEALNYYSAKIAGDINTVISDFKNQEKITESIYPFLCGGASSLNGLEKSLREKISTNESQNLFSIIKEGQGNKIDTTIATGLAYYSQDSTIISKKLDCAVGTKFFVDDEKQDFWLFLENSAYPLKEAKSFSSLLKEQQFFEYHGDETGNIEFPILLKTQENILEKIMQLNVPDSKKGDNFDLNFNIDLEDFINIQVINHTNNQNVTTRISLNTFN